MSAKGTLRVDAGGRIYIKELDERDAMLLARLVGVQESNGRRLTVEFAPDRVIDPHTPQPENLKHVDVTYSDFPNEVFRVFVALGGGADYAIQRTLEPGSETFSDENVDHLIPKLKDVLDQSLPIVIQGNPGVIKKEWSS